MFLHMLKLDQITHQSYFVQRSFGFKKWLANLMRKCFKNLIGNFSINTETTLTTEKKSPSCLGPSVPWFNIPTN